MTRPRDRDDRGRTGVWLAPLELLTVVWSIPFVILLLGIPVVLVVALLDKLGRILASLF